MNSIIFKKEQRGFTLIELLVVIAIIGLLSSVVLASLNGARIKGRDARRLSDVKQIQTALELYYNDQAAPAYPAALSSLAPDYIASVPTDPATTDSYNYTRASGGLYYCIGVVMEGSNVPSPADTCNGTTLGTTEPTGSYRVGP